MSIQLSVSKKQDGSEFAHYWSKCVGAGRANEGLRASWRDQLRLAVAECGFEYIRFHGLFHDDMFVCRETDNKLEFNFQYIDDVFDFLLEIGIRPFVEFGFCPSALAREKGTVFWWKGNGAPPSNYEKWRELILAFMKHIVHRYGLEEVRKWYFEVWNEPNLHPFFHGSKSEYFKLYQVSAEAVKSIDPELKIGGPATSNFVPDKRFDGEVEDTTEQITHKVSNLDTLEWHGVWVNDFLNFCAEAKLPVDFVSTHPYPTDFALDGHGNCAGRSRSVNSTFTDLSWLKRTIKTSPYPNAEIHLTEWSSSPSSRDHSHDFLPAATFIIKTNLDSVNLVDSLSYWVFTDIFEEGGGGFKIFHGGFGMINMQGIKKPAFHAYRFLHQLGKEKLAAVEGAFVTRDNNTLAGVIWNYPQEQIPTAVPMCPNSKDALNVMRSGDERDFEISLHDLTPGAILQVEILDEKSGCARSFWDDKGDTPTREEIIELKKHAETRIQELIIPADGTMVLKGTLPPWAIHFFKEIK